MQKGNVLILEFTFPQLRAWFQNYWPSGVFVITLLCAANETRSSAWATAVRCPVNTDGSYPWIRGGGGHVLQVRQEVLSYPAHLSYDHPLGWGVVFCRCDKRCCDIPEPQNGCPAVTARCSDHKWTSHNQLELNGCIFPCGSTSTLFSIDHIHPLLRTFKRFHHK